jgi:UDP-N-acetyl-D-glucosamine dehydrogenase
MNKHVFRRIRDKKARIGIIGLGYVGLPLVIRFCEERFPVIGFDIDPVKVNKLKRGNSYIRNIPSKKVKDLIASGLFTATMNYARLRTVDCVIICVPTPLKKNREPDLSYIEKTSEEIAKYLRKGHLISLESTTYPGTTREVLLPIFLRKNLKVGKDFNLVFSPEREDPGNPQYGTKNIPKVIGGVTPSCTKAGKELYGQIVDRVIAVSSPEVAEFTKLLENIYRSVNIALVNELKILCDRMGIDIWEIIEASSTKPFGFMPFYPGPGLGGHCIPVDPFYLSWRAKEYDFNTRFIELAGEVNTSMPEYVVSKIVSALNANGKPLKGSKILVLGVAYKRDTDDIRESPGVEIIDILKSKGSKVDYNDPHISSFSGMRHYPELKMKSIQLSDRNLKKYDSAVIITDHSNYDYRQIVKNSKLVVDTRNATKGLKSRKIVKA